MEQVSETKKARKIFSSIVDEIKRLEGKIMENPSDVMSEYIATANKSEE